MCASDIYMTCIGYIYDVHRVHRAQHAVEMWCIGLSMLLKCGASLRDQVCEGCVRWLA